MVAVGEHLTSPHLTGVQSIQLVRGASITFSRMFPGKLELWAWWDGGNSKRFSLPQVLSYERSSSKIPFVNYHGGVSLQNKA